MSSRRRSRRRRGPTGGVWAVVLILSLVFSGCAREATYRETRSLMSTFITVTVLTRDRSRAALAVDEAFSEVQRLEGVFSIWRPDTELSRVNAEAATRPVALSADVLALSKKALEMAAYTDGAFDPTIGPLVRLWRVTRRREPPGPEKIEAAKKHVDFRQVRLEDGRIRFLNDGVLFDPGGIAKGYTADRVVAVLKRHGIRGGIVAIAGDIRVFGGRARGKPWRVGIQAPRGDGVAGWMAIEEGAVSTSGDYERYFEYGGVRYHHLIDPSSGRPARGFQSVTIYARDAVTADALATGLFVMGPEKAMRRAARDGIAAVFIDATGQLTPSPAARGLVHTGSPEVP